jgi:hypothetical protein
MKKFFISICIILSLCLSCQVLASNSTLICSSCKHENNIADKFCGNCGESLEDEYQALNQKPNIPPLKLPQLSVSDQPLSPSHLFNVPTAEVIDSRDISLMGASAIGMSSGRSLFGNIGIGLGKVAEVEFSTVGLANNIARGNPTVTTSSFKIKLSPDNYFNWKHCPQLALAFRSSANWKDVNSDLSTIRANDEWTDKGIADVRYNTRFTILYGIITLPFEKVKLHAGVSSTDIRIRDTAINYYILESNYYDPVEKQKYLTGGFWGFTLDQNPQTQIMFEVETIANWSFNEEKQTIDVKNDILAIGGVRFFFIDWLSIDTGIWYQGNYRGIADTQIKLGLNLLLPTSKIIKTGDKP